MSTRKLYELTDVERDSINVLASLSQFTDSIRAALSSPVSPCGAPSVEALIHLFKTEWEYDGEPYDDDPITVRNCEAIRSLCLKTAGFSEGEIREVFPPVRPECNWPSGDNIVSHLKSRRKR